MKGNLDFINVKSEYIKGKDNLPKFKVNDKYLSSEGFAINYFKSNGFNAFFAENTLWIKLLIYLFNDELKRDETHTIGLFDMDHYLYDDDYFTENKDKYLKRFNYLSTVDLANEIKNNFHNPSKHVIELCNNVDNGKLLNVLYNLIQDFNTRKKGFPDLFVYNNEKAFFCEVKGNNDFLNYVQIKKHEVLLNNGIDIILFSINKNKKWFLKQKEKYFDDSLFRRRNFIDNYDSKIYIAKKVCNELKRDGIEEFKVEFLKKYDIDTLIAFLNILNEYSYEDKIKSINSPNQTIIVESVKKGKSINEKRILKKGKILEDKKKYKEAINEYSKVDNFKSYKRIIYCYRALKDYENEIKLIYDGINTSNFDKIDKGFFKRRLKRFFKNKKDFTQECTGSKCPECGSETVLNKFKTRNHIQFYTCSKEKCYWFGGIKK